jgi:hypothetical protein
MHAFTLSFDMENAAFADGNAPEECARILRIVAGKAASGQEGGTVWDSNGNVVGEWSADFPELDEDDEPSED